jgi:hypothetical protein
MNNLWPIISIACSVVTLLVIYATIMRFVGKYEERIESNTSDIKDLQDFKDDIVPRVARLEVKVWNGGPRPN